MSNVHQGILKPEQYASHPSGVECIAVAEHLGFRLGMAFKLVYKAISDDLLADLRKAHYYAFRELNGPLKHDNVHCSESLMRLLEQVTANEPDDLKAAYYENLFHARFALSKEIRHTSLKLAIEKLEEFIRIEESRRVAPAAI